MANRFFRRIGPDDNPSDPSKDYGPGGFADWDYRRRMRQLAEGNSSNTPPDQSLPGYINDDNDQTENRGTAHDQD